MNFGQAVTSGFKRYFDFRTRSSRSEFWFWNLFTVLAGTVLGVFQGLISAALGGLLIPLTGIFAVLTLFPGLALLVRRLHDTARSGWWILICLVPLVGFILLLIWLCTQGTSGDNRFGRDPLGAA